MICCSGFVRDSFLQLSGYAHERTYVVYNGADPAVFRDIDGRAQRAAWGYGDDDFLLVYSGAIVPEKGVEYLVRTFGTIQSRIPNAALIVVGSSGLWVGSRQDGIQTASRYETLVRNLARGLRIRFAGLVPREAMPAVYAAADAVVVPSVWNDPHPTVVCEAMAAGKPVVASRVGGIPETIVEGRTGLLVAPEDSGQLFQAIRALATDADLRRRMGQEALVRARSFTWEASARRLDSIYDEVMAGQFGVRHEPQEF